MNDEYNLGAYSEARAKDIVRGINTRLNKTAEELKLEAQEVIVTRFNDLYEKCYDKENYSDCKDILKEMAKIFGVNSGGNKVEITKDQINIEFN